MIALAIFKEREQLGLTQKQLANCLKMSLRTYQRIESGLHDICLHHLLNILDVFNIDSARFRDVFLILHQMSKRPDQSGKFSEADSKDFRHGHFFLLVSCQSMCA